MIYPRFILLFILTLASCRNVADSGPKAGRWHAELEVMDNQTLPFNFELNKSGDVYNITVYNAEEEILIDDVIVSNDSITIRMPVYEGYIQGSYSDQKMEGQFIKESLDRVVPFRATYGEAPRFSTVEEPETDVSGIWQTVFSENTEDAYDAKGIFEQRGNIVKGTFRTNKGDYRFLEGAIEGDSIKLSAFDGAHAFLFVAAVSDSTMNGIFYSGNHFKEPFIGVRNENFDLADADKLTYLKEGYEKVEFSFPDGNGNMVSLNDPAFEDKVVVVQIMGTWCPNCMDETKFLVEYLEENKHSDLQVVALAFEYARTAEAAFAGINRLKDRIGVDYPVLLAQYGSSNKVKANEKLPMLNQVLSYPTTIFIDRTGNVRRIHTGFNGPATGEKFIEFKEDFNAQITSLLNE